MAKATRRTFTHWPRLHQEGGLALGRWVEGRRRAYSRGRLSRESIRRFEQLPGWVWSTRAQGKQRGVELLRRYVNREGHARMPLSHVEAGMRLGRWVAGRRRAYRLGRLTRRERRLLEAFPGWRWRARE